MLHKCDVPRCFNPDHLFIGTHQDNTLDMIRKGRDDLRHPIPGEANGRSKLTDANVREIRDYVDAHGAPRGTYAMFARKFGVSGTLIGYVAKRQHWQHLP